MPDYQRTYNQVIDQARLIYHKNLVPDTVMQMYLEFAHMIERVVADFEGGKITESRAVLLKRSINRRLEELSQRLSFAGDGAIVQAAELAVGSHDEALRIMRTMSGRVFNYSFAEVPFQAIDMMYQRRDLGLASSFRTLINRHISYMADDVDKFLTSAVSRGVSGRRGGLELARVIARDDPALLKVLEQLGPRGGRTAQAIKAGIQIPDVEMRKAKSILFDSYRIMVHETNMAYTEADKFAAAISPVVNLVRWELSGRHFSLAFGSPDVCDLYAEGDMQGLGPGLYTPDNVPALPHSFCLCHTSNVLRPPEEWDDPKPDPATPQMIGEKETRRIFDRAPIAHKGKRRTITPRYVESQMELASSGLTRANEVIRREKVTA